MGTEIWRRRSTPSVFFGVISMFMSSTEWDEPPDLCSAGRHRPRERAWAPWGPVAWSGNLTRRRKRDQLGSPGVEHHSNHASLRARPTSRARGLVGFLTQRPFSPRLHPQRMSSFLVRSLLVCGFVATLSPAAGAQGASRQPSNDAAAASNQPGATASSRRSAFAINPLGIPFEVVSIEFERALHDAFTLAGNFSYFSPDEYTRSSVEMKGRLYPNEQAPYGFSVGFGPGAVNTRENVDMLGIEQRTDKTSP